MNRRRLTGYTILNLFFKKPFHLGYREIIHLLEVNFFSLREPSPPPSPGD